MNKEINRFYKTAPMPFMGQKRRFVNDFKEALNSFPNTTVFVDLFGGSGLLSHIAKRAYPSATVVYNDFDDYHIRIKHCERTNRLLADIRIIVKDVPKEKKLPVDVKEAVLKRVAVDEQSGFVDYITLSSSLLFSVNYVLDYSALSKATMYNNMKRDDYNCDEYLDGLEIVKKDYLELFEQYKGRKDVVFFVDPPYLSTAVGPYKCYWRLSDYLDVLNVIKDVSYIYFTSEKSSIVELLEWIEKNPDTNNPLKGAVRKETINKLTHNARYKDIMLYKKA